MASFVCMVIDCVQVQKGVCANMCSVYVVQVMMALSGSNLSVSSIIERQAANDTNTYSSKVTGGGAERAEERQKEDRKKEHLGSKWKKSVGIKSDKSTRTTAHFIVITVKCVMLYKKFLSSQ